MNLDEYQAVISEQAEDACRHVGKLYTSAYAKKPPTNAQAMLLLGCDPRMAPLSLNAKGFKLFQLGDAYATTVNIAESHTSAAKDVIAEALKQEKDPEKRARLQKLLDALKSLPSTVID